MDVMVSNEHRATISIRPLTKEVYGYLITRGKNAPQRGTITSMGKDPLQLLRLVLDDYLSLAPTTKG